MFGAFGADDPLRATADEEVPITPALSTPEGSSFLE
jgi:hypothetical protein